MKFEMEDPEHKIAELIAFRQRDKFTQSAWERRGLNPSDPVTCLRLTELFNQSADALIGGVKNDLPERRLKIILKSHLSNFSKNEYDTEEREFICDEFEILSRIIGIDFTDTLNRWLYGWVMSVILKIHATINPKRILDTIRQNCPTCGGALDTFIIRRENGIPDYCWNIVQCKNCRGYSLISHGPNVKESRFGDYTLIEQLPKEDFTEEQAKIRLEQLRHFRK